MTFNSFYADCPDMCVPRCIMCKDPIPEHRRSQGFQKRGFKTCCDECQKAQYRLKKNDNIKKINSTITMMVPAGSREDDNKARDEFIKHHFRIFALYRIGCYRHDKAANSESRMIAEALSNKFLFGKSKNIIFRSFIAFVNKYHKDADKNLYKADWLLTVAINEGWVAEDYQMVPQELKIPSGKSKREASVEPVAYPSTESNVVSLVPTRIEAKPTESNDRQQFYSGFISEAQSRNKDIGYANWLFEKKFGSQPTGLDQVSCKPSSGVQAFVNKTLADWAKMNAEKNAKTGDIATADTSDKSPERNKDKVVIDMLFRMKKSAIETTLVPTLVAEHGDIFPTRSDAVAQMNLMIDQGKLHSKYRDFGPSAHEISLAA